MTDRKRIIDTINRASKRVAPKSFWELYSMLLVRVFGEIIAEHNLLRDCYCGVRSRDFDEQFIASITTGLPGALLCPGGIDPSLFLSEKLQPIQSGGYPFLILGDVGSGKSTYIHHYFRVESKLLGLERIMAIILDMRDIGTEESDIPSFISHKLHLYLNEFHADISSPDSNLGAEIFDKELSPFIKLYSDMARNEGENISQKEKTKEILALMHDENIFVDARIRYLKRKKNKAIFIILDNVDHFSPDFQKRAFATAAKLMSEYQCPIIMTTRTYTMPIALRHSWLSAYAPRFLRLSAPDIHVMLQKRIDYLFANDEIETLFQKAGKKEISVDLPTGYSITFNLSDIKKNLNIILDSMLTEEVLSLLGNLSGGDLRYLLAMIRIALSSGYLYPEERWEKYKRVRDYDFLRAIMLGNNQYYFPDDPSVILNLFENEDKKDKWNNLVRIRILQSISIFSKDAYVPELMEGLNKMGYPEEKVKDILKLFLQCNLIESPYFEGTDINYIRKIRLTYAGQYYLQLLYKNITYLENIKHATYMPCEDQELMESLMRSGKTMEERIRARFDATEVFINFIKEEEEEEEKAIRSYRDQLPEPLRRIPKVYPNLKSSFDRAKEKILERKS